MVFIPSLSEYFYNRIVNLVEEHSLRRGEQDEKLPLVEQPPLVRDLVILSDEFKHRMGV